MTQFISKKEKIKPPCFTCTKWNNMRMDNIIIPTYNYDEFLSEAIKSALNQSYPNIHLKVVDDGSTDNTREIVEKYQVKYIYIPLRFNVLRCVFKGENHDDFNGKEVCFVNKDCI